MDFIRLLFIALLLSCVQKGWTAGEPSIHFGYPFKDSILLQNLGSDTTKIQTIGFERIQGSERGLIFEFRVNGVYYLAGVDGDQSQFVGGPYNAVTNLAIPPKSSITLSGLNIGRLPLLCPCEDALASFPSPHIFRITISDNTGKTSYMLEGDVYIRPADAIVSIRYPSKTKKSLLFKINGQIISPSVAGNALSNIQVKNTVGSSE
jgi:hypothetical protein